MFIKSKRGQVTIEMTVAWIVLLVFLMGATSLFIWFNTSLVKRQKAYERTRLAAGKLFEDYNFYLCSSSTPCTDYCGSDSDCLANCYKAGICHSPGAKRNEVSGSSFYSPETLKVFAR